MNMSEPIKTVVVNLYGGPGAGKTTCAWEIASELKKRGLNVEYVPEYAKELVWDENLKLLSDQEHIFSEQRHRIERLLGKVEVIVTDASLLNSLVYGKNRTPAFEKTVFDAYQSMTNFNMLVRRGETFQQAGRLQNLTESKQLDSQIQAMLKAHGLFFGTYSHQKMHFAIENILYMCDRVSRRPHPKATKDKRIEAQSRVEINNFHRKHGAQER